MKKLIIKIGNETHELPYNNEVFSFEVSYKYVPKVGDCVKVECKNQNNTLFYWFKVKNVSKSMVDFSLGVRGDLMTSKNGFFAIDDNRIYTQITPEELKAKYAEAGYDWDYESDTIKPLKWTPKDGDEVWWLSSSFEPAKHLFDKNDMFAQFLLKKGLLFKTEAECQKFANHCLEYFKK